MIVCCGEALIDMVPDGDRGDAFLARPGGCPYNTAIAAARLGARARFLGKIGTDFLGEMLFGRLVENGVDASLVARSEKGATLAFVQRSASGDARYAFYNEGAADVSLEASDIADDIWGGDGSGSPRFLAIGSISLLEEPVAATVEALATREGGRVLISLDPNVRPGFVHDRKAYIDRLTRLLASCAIVKASAEDLEWLYPDLGAQERLRFLLEAGASLVLETRGSGGAVAMTNRVGARLDAFAVDVADTIGAGDTFHAAFLRCLDDERIASRSDIEALDRGALERMLRFAQAAAALDCTKVGAEPPRLVEVTSFLAARR
jgi:Sugar kinases, ribokinase family